MSIPQSPQFLTLDCISLLLVDESAERSSALSSRLRDQGFAVQVAVTPAQAQAVNGTHEFDLAIVNFQFGQVPSGSVLLPPGYLGRLLTDARLNGFRREEISRCCFGIPGAFVLFMPYREEQLLEEIYGRLRNTVFDESPV